MRSSHIILQGFAWYALRRWKSTVSQHGREKAVEKQWQMEHYNFRFDRLVDHKMDDCLGYAEIRGGDALIKSYNTGRSINILHALSNGHLHLRTMVKL